MSTIRTVYELNPATSSGTLEVIIDEVVSTSYTYSAVTMSMSALASGATLTPAGLTSFLGDVNAFITQVVRLYTPSDSEPVGVHMRRVNVRANRIDADMTIDGETIVDARWTEATGEVVFQPRGAFVLRWNQWLAWVDFLGEIRRAIGAF